MAENGSLYLYPQNSCPCSERCVPSGDKLGMVYSNKLEDNKTITPASNLVCNVPEMFKHCEQRVLYSRIPYGADKKTGFVNINPQAYTEQYSKDFGKVMNPPMSGFPPITYATNDPRLFNSPHAQHITLDRPPITGQVKLNEIYDEKFRNYGNIRGGYSSVNDGQILYYVGKEREQAYFAPIFSSPASVTTSFYKTPMSGIVPEYQRGFQPWVNPTIDPKNDCAQFCGAFVHDEDFHRQELFSNYEIQQKNRIFTRRK